MTINLSETDRNRIRRLHEKHSIIKEQTTDLEGGDTFNTKSPEVSNEPKAKQMDQEDGYWDMPIFRLCNTGLVGVFTSSNFTPTGNLADLYAAAMVFMNLVNNPSQGDVVHMSIVGSSAPMAGGTPCLEYMGTHENTGTHIGLDANGGTVTHQSTYGDCTTCPGPTAEYNCGQDGTVFFCNGVPLGTGTYTGPTALADCQAACGVTQTPIECVNCPQGPIMNTVTPPDTCSSLGPDWVAYTPATPSGPFCWECQGGTSCVGPNWAGVFNSQADCQAGCSGLLWECTSPGSCSQTAAGTFPTQAACIASCPVISQTTWDCIDWTAGPGDGCVGVSGTGGAFTTLDDCLTSPCQCEQIILSWSFYTSNPNYTTGLWDGSPHDGPSNPTALSNKLIAIQNSPAYTSTNPVQEQKAKCREAAILFWQANSPAVTACCADPAFAVGAGPPVDLNGCVTQNFIDLMNNNFIPNSPSWPGQGCNWLNGALLNAQTNQVPFPIGSNGYCKLQGKIDFITNFKTTGTSPYVTGNASFPLPCI